MLLDIYIIYFVALLPVVLLISYVYKKDLYPEDKREVFITFLLGASIILFLDILIPAVEIFNNTFFKGISNKAFMSFFRAATLEETFKLLVLYYYASKLDNFNEPMDAIVFATAASLGFAAIENVNYVFHTTENQAQAFSLAFGRAFSAIPLHGLNGVIMGLFFGLALFGDKDNKKYLFLALAVPIFIHGIYNFFLLINLGILIYIILFILFSRSSKIFNRIRTGQQLKGHENWERTYTINQSEIYMNVLKITGIIMTGVIALELIFNV
tara:strand:- start:2459 stop:3265 length:807 start_codon:yes stop_codon:yes gene_type:complete